MTNIKLSEGFVKVKVDVRFYPLDIIYSAAYVFLDRAYVILDGNPEKEIVVSLKPKKTDSNLEQLGLEFNNELVNYANYQVISKMNKDIKNLILTRALLTNDSDSVKKAVLEKDEEVKIPWEDDEADN